MQGIQYALERNMYTVLVGMQKERDHQEDTDLGWIII
jgi:hypothetical protein